MRKDLSLADWLSLVDFNIPEQQINQDGARDNRKAKEQIRIKNVLQ